MNTQQSCQESIRTRFCVLDHLRSWCGRILPLALVALIGCLVASDEEAVLTRHAYKRVTRDHRLSFPADHGPHREFAYEWWYFTGHLFGSAPSAAAPNEVARPTAGFEVTVFRISPAAAGWLQLSAAQEMKAARPNDPSYLSLHVAVTDLQQHTFRYRTTGLRERTGVAELRSTPEHPLQLTMPGASIEFDATAQALRLDANLGEAPEPPLHVHAQLASRKPVTLHGESGFSFKGGCADCASYYSGFTRLVGQGAVQGNGPLQTGAVQAWFDHEFGSNTLSGGQVGWDWLSLQLDDGWDMMLIGLRDKQGRSLHRAGTLVSPAGQTYSLTPDQLQLTPQGEWDSPHTHAHYPQRWQIQVSHPAHPLTATVVPHLQDQELAGDRTALSRYWEGSCSLLVGGQQAGSAYLEMTGYDSSSRPSF